MNISLRRQLLWMVTAGALGFAGSATFSGLFRWPRSTFVLAHGTLVAAFLVAYFRLNRINPLTQIRRRWASGMIGGLLLGLLLARGVFSQPGSPRPTGSGLMWSLVRLGVVYGTVDALLLNIVPVLGLYGTRSGEELRQPGARLRWGSIALAGSLAVTALYHLGFAEFRGSALLQPLAGNAIITAGYLLTGSPLTPLIGHVVMHSAAVAHGMDTTVQLPPHY